MTAKKAKPPPEWLSGFCGADLPDESHARCRGEAAGMPCVCTREGVHSTPHINEPPPVVVGLDPAAADSDDMTVIYATPPAKPGDPLIYPSTADAATITTTASIGGSRHPMGWLDELNAWAAGEVSPRADDMGGTTTLTPARPEDWLAELGQHLADGLLHPPPVPSAHDHEAYRAGWHAALTYAIRGLMYGRAVRPPEEPEWSPAEAFDPPAECDCPPPYADCPHPPPVVP